MSVPKRRLISLGLVLIIAFYFAGGGSIQTSGFRAVGAAAAAQSGPTAGLKPLDAGGGMQISEADRCPVCAMKVARYPKFSGAIQLEDRRTFYFCGPGCLIRSWMHPEVFLGVGREALRRSVVRAYFSGEQVDGASVIWVAGSDVMGPMGPAPVPLKTEGEAAAFQRRHGGRLTFRLADMTDTLWEAITGKKAVPDPKR